MHPQTDPDHIRRAASDADADLAAARRREAALRLVRDDETVSPSDEAPVPDPPLFQATTSAIGGDVDAAGDRLCVWADHIELRDGKDRLRASIEIGAVDQVEVRKRLTSSTLTVLGGNGERLVLKGVKGPSAARFRDIVAGLTMPSEAAGASTPTAEALRRLDELAAMGLLTDREVAEKRSLLAQRGIHRRG